MSEIKTLNGYALADETARAGVKANADAIAAINSRIAAPRTALTDEQTAACQQFSSLFKDIEGKAESFLFFTDPHLCEAENVMGSFSPWLDQIASVYNSTPTSMCICGGDWLCSNNTKDNACWMLGLIDGAMKARFDRYVNIVGNHDTNYQGFEYIQSEYDRNECRKCELSAAAIRSLWYRQQGNCYFVVDGDCTRFYVFDSGLDWYSEMSEYRWEQIDWFAKSLLNDKPERSVVLTHIAERGCVPTPLIESILQVAEAYNSRTSITLNGTTYDFGNEAGRIGFILAGHRHGDLTLTHKSIPVIVTTNLRQDNRQPTFDLVLIDWEAMVVHLTRVGSGESRSVSLITQK